MKILKMLCVAVIASTTSLVAAGNNNVQNPNDQAPQGMNSDQGARGVENPDGNQNPPEQPPQMANTNQGDTNIGRGFCCGRGCGCDSSYGYGCSDDYYGCGSCGRGRYSNDYYSYGSCGNGCCGNYYGGNSYGYYDSSRYGRRAYDDSNMRPARQSHQTATNYLLNKNQSTQFGQNQGRNQNRQNQQPVAFNDEPTSNPGYSRTTAANDLPAMASESDRALAEKVQTALRRDTTLSPNVTNVQVIANADEGKVTLTGFVPSKSEKSQIEAIARHVDGVKSVYNNLTTR